MVGGGDIGFLYYRLGGKPRVFTPNKERYGGVYGT